MGSGETAPPSKVPPKASSAQEQTPATSSSPVTTATSSAAVVYPDWSGFQAYSPVPPHGFFPPVVSSPQTHPYMWGTQNMMTPYGTPPPPFVMYPHAGVYVHPSVPPGAHPFNPYAVPSPGGNPEAFSAGPEVDGKSSEGKEGSNLKRSNGSLGNLNSIAGKSTKETGKPSGASANGGFSQSDSGSEGSSEGSDADSQNDSQGKTAGGEDSVDVRASRNGGTTRGSQNGSARAPAHGPVTQPMPMMPVLPAGGPGAVSGPTTNLNIGMDYWGSPAIAPMRGKVHNAPGGVLVSPGQSVPSELRLQDERELKRERRKQSNRESARRSRLRKQAECDELAQRVESLQQENATLTAEVTRVRKDYEQLLSENNSLKERVGQITKGTEDLQQSRKEDDSAGDDREGPVDSSAGAAL
ncbi:unnamed protein product [Spirodela intermedia]|uniref:BZIP domain-containing protein n=2 Tax=Spirodela intermedia TaxID=51605 RepID=A0A7I8L1C4_SPIIN|nr:unnamed protein product [Spirodela intermedia]CAA6667034.1 unnamed protein product [Spirodela intermedia]CAA7403847.1 unnamed protein product [Spirodela intermedia]